MGKKFEKIISSLENSKKPFIYFVFAFFFAITLRNFLEIFSSSASINLLRFLHYDFSYIFIALGIITLFHLATKTDIIKVSRVVLPSFMILNLAPIVDLLISRGNGYIMTYMMPEIHTNLVSRFFTFFGDFTGTGITPGIRIEILLVLIGTFVYFKYKKLSPVKNIFATFMTYLLIFTYLSTPFLIKGIFYIIGENYIPDNLIFALFFLTITLIIGLFLAYLSNKEYFKNILKDIRLSRLLHFELMFLLGILLAGNQSFNDINGNIFYFVLATVSITCAWIFSVMTNNLEDYKIDEISNKDRPLISSKIEIKIYKKIAWFFLPTSLLCAAMLDFKTFFIILLFIGNYFLYSMPPLRLKRVPLLSKLIISFNSLLLVMLGFLATGNLDSIKYFPGSIFSIFLIGFTIVINFIDIKDYEGDKKAGIKTLPTLIGLKKSKFIIGLSFLLTYLSVLLVIKNVFALIFALFFGILQFYLINRKKYNEGYVFWAYLSSLTILMLYILMTGFKLQ